MFTYLSGLRIRVTFLNRLPTFRRRFPWNERGAVQPIGREELHLTNMISKDEIGKVGRTALNRGSRNPPLGTISFFFLERGPRLSESLRSAALCFCNLRVTQPVSFIFPFNTFRTYSLIQLTSSLLHFEIIALRNFGSADFSTWRVGSFLFTRFFAYIRINDEEYTWQAKYMNCFLSLTF